MSIFASLNSNGLLIVALLPFPISKFLSHFFSFFFALYTFAAMFFLSLSKYLFLERFAYIYTYIRVYTFIFLPACKTEKQQSKFVAFARVYRNNNGKYINPHDVLFE